MVKRKPTPVKNHVDPSRKRRKGVTGNPGSRRSLRRKGVKGDSLEVLFPGGSPKVLFRRSDYGRPICRMYGLDRNYVYKGFYFCSNCKLADEFAVTKGLFKSSCRPVGTRTVCLAQHNSYAYPTQKSHGHHYLKACVRSVNNDSSYLMKQRKKNDEVTGTNSDVARLTERTDRRVTLSNLKSVIRHKDTELKNKQVELNNVQSNLSDTKIMLNSLRSNLQSSEVSLIEKYEHVRRQESELNVLMEDKEKQNGLIIKLQSTLEKIRHTLNEQVRRRGERIVELEGLSTDSLVDTVCALLSVITGTKNCSQRRRSSAFSELLLDGTIMDGELSDSLRKKVFCEVRSTVFSAPELIRKMDEVGFTLNYSALSAIRSMEQTMNGKYHRGIFPCKSTLQKSMHIVHAFGDHVLPFVLTRFPTALGGGELAKFLQELVLKALVKSHGLMGKAKTERVGVGYAYDGTKVDSRTYLEISGFKVTDRDAKDPKTGRILYGNGLQSSACSFPDTLGIAKDTKDVFELYKPRFKRVSDEAETKGEPMLGTYVGDDGVVRKFKHIEATSEMDMKTVWMINSVGCAAKQGGTDVMFCSFCSLTNGEIATGTKDLCHKWCREFNRDDEEGWLCHHVDMVTEEHVQKCKIDISEMESLHVFLQEMETTKSLCKLHNDGDPSIGCTGPQNQNDPHSIHFEYNSCTLPQKIEFLNCVRNDLSIRQLSTDGSARDRVDRLRSAMIQEYAFVKLQKAVKRGTIDREGAVCLILNNPPCLLHLEIRCGIKIITTLLQNGLSYALNGKLDSTAEIGNKQVRLQVFTKEVNECFNRKLWGTATDPGFWEMPTEKDKDGNVVLSTLSFGNGRTRNAIHNIEALIDVCLLPDERQDWKVCIGDYRAALNIATRHDDLTDEEIHEFQRHADNFYQLWIKVALGKRGVTNYIHLLGSGHVAEFLFRWRNLYAHSQQGWEALNSLVKSVYRRRTNRGGGTGRKSKLYAVARWCQRRMLWSSGYTFEYMKEQVVLNNWTVSDVFENHAVDLPDEDVYYEEIEGFI